MRVLSGDIGGTKTRVAELELGAHGVVTLREVTYDSSSYGSLEHIVKEFLGTQREPTDLAGFGVAGPVRQQRCETTNLPWVVDARAMERDLGLPRVTLTNDLEATAWGISALQPADLSILHPGDPDPKGNLSVVAAGTGLGEAGICRAQAEPRPFGSEGGHADFAPSNELEFALYQYLAQRHGHVSWERLVSGPGIGDIFSFLCHFKGIDIPQWVEPDLLAGDAGGAISKAADAGQCETCEKTMELFVRLYGREAGNHALKIMATGGVYLGGGIAPKILPRLQEPAFLEAFFSKGRMEPLMRNMPVQVILNDKAALYGAALAAAHSSDG